MENTWLLNVKSKIYYARHKLKESIDYLKEEQELTFVFTNGCFDILHAGHIDYLCRARQLGDKLIVAVNSDKSVKQLKGETRPINSWEDRAFVLASLSCLDYVVAFEENDPTAIIEYLKPNVHCKGGDYEAETLPESKILKELGASIEILPFIENRSTSQMISKINKIR